MADPTAVHDDDVRLLGALRLAARSLTANDRPDLDATIQQIVTSAVDTVAPAAGGGISRTTASTVHSAYATGPDVRRLDELQSELQEGPCVTAAAAPPGDGVVLAADLAGRDRDRWPAFSAHAVALPPWRPGTSSARPRACSPSASTSANDDAFGMLVRASQASNIKLVEVARWLLDDARRATKGPISGPPTGGPPLSGRPTR